MKTLRKLTALRHTFLIPIIDFLFLELVMVFQKVFVKTLPMPVVESPRQQVSPVSAPEPVEVDETKMKMLEYRLKRSQGKGKEIAIVAVLALVCFLLIAVLGLVVTKQF